jgi:hypothetical protein
LYNFLLWESGFWDSFCEKWININNWTCVNPKCCKSHLSSCSSVVCLDFLIKTYSRSSFFAPSPLHALAPSKCWRRHLQWNGTSSSSRW